MPDALGDVEYGVSVFPDMAPNRTWYDIVDGRRVPHWRSGHFRLYGKVGGRVFCMVTERMSYRKFRFDM